MVVIYLLDAHSSLAEAETANIVPVGSKKRRTITGTHTIARDYLMQYGTRLGHLDVSSNMGPPFTCEECSQVCDRVRACDGTYPTNVGLSFPDGALGRQHACHRGVLCAPCSRKPIAQRRKQWEFHKDYFLCTACCIPPASHNAVWGHSVLEPSFLIPHGTMHPGSPPSPSCALALQPADAYDARNESKAAKVREGAIKYASHGGEMAILASAQFHRTVSASFMPKAQQEEVLAVIHDLHDKGLLVSSARSEHPVLLLPKDVETMHARARCGILSEDDVEVNKGTFSLHDLGQQQESVDFFYGDCETAIQSMLLDKNMNPRQLYLRPNNCALDYVNIQGEPLYGPELYQSHRFKELEATAPFGATVLVLVVHSDGTSGLKGSRYPFQIQIGNYGYATRALNCGSNIHGYGSTVNVHRNRGNDVAVNLTDAQRIVKRKVYASTPAHMFADLDELAKTGRTFYVRQEDGSLKRLALHIRIILWVADFEEKMKLLAITSNACPRCLHLQEGLRKEALEGRTGKEARPYLRLDSGCALNVPRTAHFTFVHQASVLQKRRLAGVKAAKSMLPGSGVCAEVESSILRLSTILPDKVGGAFEAFAPDLLHSLHLGLVKKFITMVDALIIMMHVKTKDFKSTEDARDRLDRRLSKVPPYPGALTFKFGWWEASNINGASGAELWNLLWQLVFVYTDDELLIADDELRKRVIALHCTLINFGREITTPQTYTAEQLEQLDGTWVLLTSEFWWMMDVLGNNCPGNGMDIPKLHDLSTPGSSIWRWGTLVNASSSPFEKNMKYVKACDYGIGRSRRNDGTETLFRKTVSNQRNAAEVASDVSETSYAEVEVGPAEGDVGLSGNARYVLGSGAEWARITHELRRGDGGPGIDIDVLSVASSCFTSDEGIRSSSTQGIVFASTADFMESDIHSLERSRRILRPGHCVELFNGTFCQVLLPLVHARKTGHAYDKSDDARTALVATFELMVSDTPLHPDLHLMWLKRSEAAHARLIPLSSVRRRKHVMPIFRGGASSSPCEEFAQSFILNEFVHPLRRGLRNEEIFILCNSDGCVNKIPAPTTVGTTLVCSACGATKPWFP